LEKFAINSVISATHTGEMDSEDQKDIIDKVKDSGQEGGDDIDVDVDVNGEDVPVDGGEDELDFEEEPQEENFKFESLQNSEKNSIFVEDIKKGLSEHHDMNYTNYGKYDDEEYMLDIKAEGETETAEPDVKPDVKPSTEPTKPNRRNKPWTTRPMQPSTTPKPKAED